jgi:biotin carboxylase
VRCTLNKFHGRSRLRDAGLDVPAFHLLPLDIPPATAAARVACAVGFPAVLKPLAMAASRGVVRVNDPAECAATFERLRALVLAASGPGDELAAGHVLAESFVAGWEVAVEGLVDRGRLHVLAVFDKPDPLDGPYFPETLYVTPSRKPEKTRERITAATADTVRALGLDHGPVHVELRGDDRRVVAIEAHARSIGGLCSRVLRFHDGRSLEDLILQHALGWVTRVPPREPLAAGVWMMQAPRAGRFLGMEGVEEARAVADVSEVVVSAREGQALESLPDGFLYIGFIFARAPSPGRVETALRAAFARLSPRIEDAVSEAGRA